MIDVPKSTAGDRSIDLIPTLVSALREHLLKTPKTALDLVFPTPGGGVFDEDTINRALQKAQLRAGVVNALGKHKYTAHKLRHFFASWCINSRADGGLGMAHEPKRIQQWLGHANIRLTFETYGHLFPRSDASAELAAADAAFFGKPAPTATVTMLKPRSETVPVEDEAAPPPMPTPVTGLNLISETVPVDDVPQPKPSQVVAPTPALTPSPVARPKPISATIAAFDRAKAAILAHPDMPTRALVSKIGVSRGVIDRARAALKNPGAVSMTVSVEGRSTLGQFLPGSRYTAKMARVEAGVLANPDMSVQALARKLGVNKTTVLNARKRLNPGSEVSVEGRSTLGQFLPGSRYTAKMARVEAGVLANPDMSVQALANKIGVGKTSVKRARKRLESKRGEKPVSEAPVEEGR
jgi:transposase-like protein